MTRSRLLPVIILSLAIAVGACGPGRDFGAIKFIDQGMRFSVTAESLPPHAQDLVTYRITVRDMKTGEPIEGGQGRIFASIQIAEGLPHTIHDGVVQAPELGTYTGRLMYVSAGLWSVALEFRRDSLSPFARGDWRQEVLPPPPLGVGGSPR